MQGYFQHVIGVITSFSITIIKISIFLLVTTLNALCILERQTQTNDYYFIAGVRWTISSLSEAPTKASDYTNQGLQYLKDLTK